MSKINDTLEFIKLVETLRDKDRELFIETKGYLKGLVRSDLQNRDMEVKK